MDRFDKCHPITKTWEGGWSDHPNDPGGKTMYGVTQAVYHAWLRKHGRKMRPVRGITMKEALAIYRENYWNPTVGKYNLVPGVDLAVYDAAVNSGVSRGLKWMRASVGSNDHSVTVRRICRKRLSFMQSLRIWRTFRRGWSRRVADIEVKGVAMALAFMARGEPKARTKVNLKLKEIARREVKDATAEQKAKKKAAGTAGAAGAGSGGSTAVDPSLLDQYAGLILIGVAGLAAIAVVAFVLQARAAADRKEAYQKGGLS